jgi:7,8-dihydropterin-6-yl-methyl-4-(beta-D-ribofuranosyl)aminobenzene 5'-phosphate synthase
MPAMRTAPAVLAVAVVAVLAPLAGQAPAPAPAAGAVVRALKVTILSTMLADTQGIGEWGFAALVEADGYRLLFDTGARPETVRQNARELKVDLTGVRDVLLTHNHDDHTGGLITLRKDVMGANREALSRLYVGKGLFYPRIDGSGQRIANTQRMKAAYEALGGVVTEVDQPRQLAPGVWLTGPVRRIHPERNWSGSFRVETPEGIVDDTVQEDTSLVVDTAEGLVVITGCGHAGIVNTMEQARRMVPGKPVRTLVGGMHLFDAGDDALAWTAGRMKAFGVQQMLGAHCTGIEAVFRIREGVGLPRAACLVGAVGASFDLAAGIHPGRVAK